MRKCLVVLGMHRSGTSAATGVLARLGVDIGATVMDPTPVNPKGFFENQRIREIDDRILEALGTFWDGPFAAQKGWERSDALDTLREECAKALAAEFEHGRLIGIKDPRLCLLLPFWQPLFDRLGLAPGFVVVVRHPLEVAASLTAGYGFSTEKGVLLWMQHMLAAEKSTRGKPRLFLSFNTLLNRPREFFERVTFDLGVAFSRPWDQAEAEVLRFLDPALKHHAQKTAGPASDGTGEALKYFNILSRMADSAAERDREADRRAVDGIRERFQEGLGLFYHREILALASQGRPAETGEAVLHGQTEHLKSEMAARNHLAGRLLSHIEAQHAALLRCREEVAALRCELKLIKGSKAWRTAECLRRWGYGRVLGRRQPAEKR